MNETLFFFIGVAITILVVCPIVFCYALNKVKEQREKTEGDAEQQASKQMLHITQKDILAQRVDMRIWDALITKFGPGMVTSYKPMTSYTEGGDMDIVVTFSNGTSGIYRAYLPLCKIRGAEKKNQSDDYRKKPSEWLNKQSDMEKIVAFINKNIVNGKPLLIPASMYADMDVDVLSEDLMFEEIADSVEVTHEGIVVISNKITA